MHDCDQVIHISHEKSNIEFRILSVSAKSVYFFCNFHFIKT